MWVEVIEKDRLNVSVMPYRANCTITTIYHDKVGLLPSTAYVSEPSFTNWQKNTNHQFGKKMVIIHKI